MSSVNKVILLGNLGRDPEVRHTQSGDKIVQLSVATSESWRDKQSGERKEKTEWHRVVIFNDRLADVAERHLRKGSSVYLEGSIQTRKWTDQSGAERYSTEIVLQKFRGELVLLGGKADSGQEPDMSQAVQVSEVQRTKPMSDDERRLREAYRLDGKPPNRGRARSAELRQDDLDDEIPF